MPIIVMMSEATMSVTTLSKLSTVGFYVSGYIWTSVGEGWGPNVFNMLLLCTVGRRWMKGYSPYPSRYYCATLIL